MEYSSTTLRFYATVSSYQHQPNDIVICLSFLPSLRFETYAADGNTSSKLGKRIRVAAANMLNINISAANLETFVESTVSWRRILELEQKAAKLNEVIQGSTILQIHISIVALYCLTACYFSGSWQRSEEWPEANSFCPG